MSTRIAVIVPAGWPLTDRISMVDVDPKRVWATCQELVRGHIEIVQLTPYEATPENEQAPFSQGWHLACYVNEDGIAKGMRPNVQLTNGIMLWGPVVFVNERVDGNGDTHYRDVTEDDWDRIKTLIQSLFFGATEDAPPESTDPA